MRKKEEKKFTQIRKFWPLFTTFSESFDFFVAVLEFDELLMEMLDRSNDFSL
jgi:hypothetical protein